MSEADLQRLIIDAAQMFGWRVAHFRAARTSDGWRSPVAADGAGFPDIVAVHERRGLVLFAELKAHRGRVSDQQKAWLAALGAAGGPGVYVRLWRPADADAAVAFLRGH